MVEFVEKLDKAGVAPQRLCKELGVHDWILFDLVRPQFLQK